MKIRTLLHKRSSISKKVYLLTSLLAKPECYITIHNWNAYFNVFKLLLLFNPKKGEIFFKLVMMTNLLKRLQNKISGLALLSSIEERKRRTFSSDLVILVLRDLRVGSLVSG
jgi:hypothetical protein